MILSKIWLSFFMVCLIIAALFADNSLIEKPADLPDLDITFISRSPRYERLCVAYHKRRDGKAGDVRPYLSAAEQTKKRWPEEDEIVTFTAHIKNHGTQKVEGYDFLWFIDGKIMDSGIGGALEPAGEAGFTYQWKWKKGAHTVSFQVDPQDIVTEISQRNNCLSDRIDALAFHFHVEQSLYEYFTTIKNCWGTYSWEDWAQHHIALMNELFKSSKYPLTPDGIVERVRLDKITIHPDGSLDKSGTHAPEDLEWDGRWGFTSDYLKSKFYEKNPWAIEHEWSLIHELGHQLGRIDLYCLDITKEQNHVNGAAYRCKYQNGLMHRGIYLPQAEVHYFCEHTAASFNRDKAVRRGHFGEYLLDIPDENCIQILNDQYRPLAGAAVNVYQPEPLGYTAKVLGKTPKFSGKTDADGFFQLGKNPFGEINNWGTNGILLIEIKVGNEADYEWLEITDFNLEYRRGNHEKAVFKIITKL